MKNICLIVFFLFISVELFSENNSYNNSAHIGIISDNPNKSIFGTIGVTKQYIFNDFMIGMDFNLLLLGQEQFKDFAGMLVSPKLGMIFYGDDKSNLYSSIILTTGISSINNDESNSLGLNGGIGLETRYKSFGINIGYMTNLNRNLQFEGMKLDLNYWF